MNELDKLKLTQLPYVVKDIEGNAIGQITAIINHNLTNANFTMNFYTEDRVIGNKDLIKKAYIDMQDFFKREMINCGWGFLFEEEVVEDSETTNDDVNNESDTEENLDTEVETETNVGTEIETEITT